jgi:hypothetical protein
MNINTINIEENDVVMATINVGNIPPNEIDNYIKKPMEVLNEAFGCTVFGIPVREGGWDFTIIKKPIIIKKSKVSNKSKKV